MKLLHIYQIEHFLDVHNPAYVLWACPKNLNFEVTFRDIWLLRSFRTLYSERLLAFKYFRETLHLRWLTGFWKHHWPSISSSIILATAGRLLALTGCFLLTETWLWRMAPFQLLTIALQEVCLPCHHHHHLDTRLSV